MTEPTKNPGELPTYHGICPYCASAVSCVTRDEMTYARCSHRGCGARGPYHCDLVRSVELFTRMDHPTRAHAAGVDAPRVDAGCEECFGHRCILDGLSTALIPCPKCTGRTEAAKGGE